MLRCPKCGSKNIRGPHYNAGHTYPHYEECLVYTCQCGYSETRPCHDSRTKRDRDCFGRIAEHFDKLEQLAKGGS